MGGHGALSLYLASKTNQYRSASAFSPISNPTKCPWGEKAFNGYLQNGVEEAKELYDATELIAKHKDPVHILIDYVNLLLVYYYLCKMIDLFTGHGRYLLPTGSTPSRKFLESCS